ncbi:hypothetical protein [Marispirochaeta aestuarii]|uniref:hypothetical protein n=1 Tax=Marispirochaeta aestuarii TaxID=1963862 RepID=UPI0029C87A0F|nr:hypothetical protein [Marispirochaeta aestuarii]
MKHKRTEFILHLISEVAHFVLDADPSRMVISLHQEKDGLHLAIFDDRTRNAEELESIRKSLEHQERPELAGYYGSMAGYDMLGEARLDLVGWQIKAATVSDTGSGTQIDLWLGGDRFDPEKFTLGNTKQ